MTTPSNGIPRLCAGDRLTRDEFERRYTAMPECRKAELIEGVVYMPSPVSVRHGHPHSLLGGWLVHYSAATPGLATYDNTTLRLDLDNEPQPDLLLRIASARGVCRVGGDDYLEGAPEFVAEIAATSASYDLHDKRNAYRRNGVQEYLVWRVLDEAIDWFALRGGRYESLAADREGVLRSEVCPGLWLDVPRLLADDIAAVLRRLDQGLADPAHAAFVARLRS